MEIIEVEDNYKWNEFVKSVSPNRFSQAWEWGEFQETRGFGVKRLALGKENRFLAGASFIEYGLPGFRYWYAPAGPVFSKRGGEEEKKNFFSLLKKEAQKKGKVLFLRLEPEEKLPDIGYKLEKSWEIQPSRSLILDLTRPEEEILARMHQKTRYNIRLALRKGVEVREAGPGEFEKWWEILRRTGERDKFRIHPREHYEKMLNLGKEGGQQGLQIKLYLARYQGKIIAGNIVVFFGDTATYLHGASTYEDRKVMAPYALQWRLIHQAKAEGYSFYDFYGINEEKWPGVTRFKKGFGGRVVERPGTRDLIFKQSWYNVYKLLRYLRRKI